MLRQKVYAGCGLCARRLKQFSNFWRQIIRYNEEFARRIAKLRQAYEAGILDEDTYQSSLAALAAQSSPPTAKAENRGVAVAKSVKDSNLISGDDNRIIFVESGAKVVFGEEPVHMSSEMRNTALRRYLHHLISRNRYLQLQGIRSGGKLVHIELDRIYIRVRATQQRVMEAEERWLAEEATLVPSELHRLLGRGYEGMPRMTTEIATVAVEEALNLHFILSFILHLDGRTTAFALHLLADSLVSKSLFNLQF